MASLGFDRGVATPLQWSEDCAFGAPVPCRELGGGVVFRGGESMSKARSGLNLWRAITWGFAAATVLSTSGSVFAGDCEEPLVLDGTFRLGEATVPPGA